MNRTAKLLIVAMFTSVEQVHAQQHQTTNFSPILDASSVPYHLEIRQYDFGPAELPTLHSFAAAEYDGKWVLLGARTNGLHGFEQSGSTNFPEEFQNREVWVVDPVTEQA